MKAGAELDMAMALGPMGYNKSTAAIGDPNSSVPGKCTIRSKPDAPTEYDRWTIFQPSTNIAHAMEVVEVLTKRGMTFRLSFALTWMATFDEHRAEGDSAPLVICLAALRATEGKGQ